jgi:hypothetical protein
VKIKDGLNLPSGRIGRVEIPDCNRADLSQFFVEMGIVTVVEIGVYKAYNIERLCQAGLTVFGVDPWEAYPEYYIENTEGYETPQAREDAFYEFSKKVVEPYPNCTLIRKKSMDAVKDFADNSLDAVYIDGHHALPFVIMDLWEWSKKVRPGGIVAGHDYSQTKAGPLDPHALHVKYAVDAFVQSMRIPKWYILGRREKISGEKRDTFRSFMWFKP